ncbi:hypothetical protein OIU84_000118 [Salix udensis]|uniref:Peptidase A1 domain-containing protein n=1 Tax=Salix udensis TaxID=889485 RepID=A0AAD6L3V3_9ROSI|nr:hypothetical protein OIU84_000118 [Salix udensis]
MKCFLYAPFLCLCLLFSLEKSYGFEGRENAENHHSHTIETSSLFPSTSCKSSTKILSNNDTKASLEVVHKHGPCSTLNLDKTIAAPTDKEILLQDQSRVKSIHSRLSNSKTSGGNDVKVIDATTIPAKDGRRNWFSQLYCDCGTWHAPEGTLFEFSTLAVTLPGHNASHVRGLAINKWSRYLIQVNQHRTPTFHAPHQSAVSLTSATGIDPACDSSTCVYAIQYGDSSFTIGFFGAEKLTLTSTDVFNNIYFGCGQNNQGLFGGSAGILGLGRDNLSVVSQTADKYNKMFSYCLPSSSSSTGFLTFGCSDTKNAKFTPLSTSVGPFFYGLDFTGISVGGKKLAISASVFSTAGAIIDSGTVISRLPPAAYSALRASFKKLMSKYPLTKALSILDTCYDFSNYTTISVPKIGFFFSSGIEVDIDVSGVFSRVTYPKCAWHLLEIVMQLICSSSEMFSKKH